MTDKKVFTGKIKLVLLISLAVAVVGAVVQLIFGFYAESGHSSVITSDSMGMFVLKCLYAVLILAILLFIYVWIRFNKLRWFSAFISSAVTALIASALFFFIYTIIRVPFSDFFFASLAAVFCYTAYNVSMIFEKYRERKVELVDKASKEEIMNLSIGQAFKPLLISSCIIYLAAVVVIVVSLFTGSFGIARYMLPLLLGLAVSFILSIFVAGPLWIKFSRSSSSPSQKKSSGKNGKKK